MARSGMDEFEGMWTQPGFRLDRLPDGRLVPVQTIDGADYAVLIDEDDELARRVVDRMIAAGVPVHDVGPVAEPDAP